VLALLHVFQCLKHLCLVLISRLEPKKAGAAAQYVSHHLQLIHDYMWRTEVIQQKVLALQVVLAMELSSDETLQQCVICKTAELQSVK